MGADLSPATQRWMASGRHVNVGSHSIFVVEEGEGLPLLLMHGFPTSCYDWRGVMAELRSDYRCIAFDFPGFGLSDKPEAYSYSLFQQADAAEALMRELGIAAAHVVCHDMGTSVHCELLARHNAGALGFDVLSSTFLNGSMLMWMATITPFQKLLASNETLQQAIDICDGEMAAYVAGLKGIMKRPEAITDEDATVMLDLLRYRDGNRRLPALAGYMRERYVHAGRWVGALGATKAPLQFVWADGDPIANIAMGRELHRLHPNAGYAEMPGLGHFLLMEDPPAVAAMVREFVAPVRPGA